MGKYAYGFDFGTDSCRLSCVNIQTGESFPELIEDYPHGVISETLPGSKVELSSATYLQDPEDYLYVLEKLSRDMLQATGVSPEEIVCIGTDFTNCTVVPIDVNGNALCQDPRYRGNPHAWVKLWKHHGAEYCAKEIERHALKHWPRIHDYGDNVSSEWFFPKVLQILREDYDLYCLTDTYLEACDWIVLQMTGKLVRNSACLGLNAFYNEDFGGYPTEEFFESIDPRFKDVVKEKMKGSVKKVGSPAGTLTLDMAKRMGLHQKVVVSVGHGDAEIGALGAGVVKDGEMLLVMGTSTCQQMISHNKSAFSGMCAVVKDGMIPGMYSYESGQPAVGDIFKWFSNNAVSAELVNEAKQRNIPMLKLLDEKAGSLLPGESGILCLDWLNGNRSTLMDYNLTGACFGITLDSKPWEIYRGFIEATAFGCRKIVDSYQDAGILVSRFVASGGLPHKSPLVSQIYADVLNKPLYVPNISNISTLGSAVCAAVALGKSGGGYDTFIDAVRAMVRTDGKTYTPNPKNVHVYQQLYQIYEELYTLMGLKNNAMHRLKELRNHTKENKFCIKSN